MPRPADLDQLPRQQCEKHGQVALRGCRACAEHASQDSAYRRARMGLLAFVATRLATTDIVPALALARLTELRKPDGGVRGIATGDVFRLVSPALAKGWATAFDQATYSREALTTTHNCTVTQHNRNQSHYIQPCATDALFWRDIGRRRQVLILRNPIGRSQILLPHRFGRSGRVRQTCKEVATATSSVRRASNQTRKGASARNMSRRALWALLHCEKYSREALTTTHNCTV